MSVQQYNTIQINEVQYYLELTNIRHIISTTRRSEAWKYLPVEGDCDDVKAVVRSSEKRFGGFWVIEMKLNQPFQLSL